MQESYVCSLSSSGQRSGQIIPHRGLSKKMYQSRFFTRLLCSVTLLCVNIEEVLSKQSAIFYNKESDSKFHPL